MFTLPALLQLQIEYIMGDDMSGKRTQAAEGKDEIPIVLSDYKREHEGKCHISFLKRELSIT